MILRLTTACLLLTAATAGAGPYAVTFSGSITEIDEGVPAGFSIGERVAGGFVYDPDAESAYSVTTVYTLTDGAGDPGSGWGSAYSGFPLPSAGYGFAVLFRGGAFAIQTEGGFSAHDHAIDFRSLRSGDFDLGQAVGDVILPIDVSNSGRLANALLGVETVPSTLVVDQEPPALGVVLSLGTPDPLAVESLDELHELQLKDLLPPNAFPGVTGGKLEFENAESLADMPMGVSFEVTEYQIAAVPEPTNIALAVLAVLVCVSRRARGNPARGTLLRAPRAFVVPVLFFGFDPPVLLL